MLADVIDLLICPVCATSLTLHGGAVRCGRRHSFDVARQGYVNLLTGPGTPGTADTPGMVVARARFLTAGHYAPLAARLARLCVGAKVLADAGAGTGHYLAAALGAEAVGIALDVSKHALRRAARAHPRIGAVAADVWRRLPVRDGAVDALLTVRETAELTLSLGQAAVAAMVGMGPTARHVSAEVLAGRIHRLPDPVSVTGMF